MDNFLLLKDGDKKVYFDVVSNELDVTPQLIEKDFWVCWILKTLFTLPASGKHLTFKGGTSLSKCYNIIKRFSEDVDVSIERSFLSTHEPIEPDGEQSGKENQRRLARLKQACQEKIADVVIPELEDKIKTALSGIGEWQIKLDPDDPDKQTVLFTYPSVVDNDVSGGYVQPVVKIEFGARSDHWPVETMFVSPYVSSAAGKVTIEGTQVRVLGAERTFWEKATILHAISHGSKLRARMSRHYYDVGEMVGSSIYSKAIQNIDLLIKVAEHKTLFFEDSKARYDLAKPGSLRLMPLKEHLVQLNDDYRQMQEMFFEDSPSFESVLEKLKTAEEEINRIKQ
ncbi:MAG: nucleotidyl transferase AbiEii/AbiGii toxin family protein [Candidatus Omnitrophica bacterium]|nr:nucleotidyl transferase AbiEii/AbiGii toxin family protein [Candidatus Omnitrophota bacterium]